MGVSDALNAHETAIRIVGLEPAASAAITGGGERGSFAMQGWTGLRAAALGSPRVDAVSDDRERRRRSR